MLALLVGPFIFFSDIGGFVQTNPISGGDIKVSLVINKTLTLADLEDSNLTDPEKWSIRNMY